MLAKWYFTGQELVPRNGTSSEMAQRTIGNAQSSPLLHLPGEIRTHIYDFAFNDFQICVHYYVKPAKSPKDFTMIGDEKGRAQYEMLLTCRQMYSEMLLSIYRAATFELMSPAVLVDWISVLSEDKKAALRHIKFTFHLPSNTAARRAQLRGFEVLGSTDWKPLGRACAELSCLERVSVMLSLEVFAKSTLRYALKELRTVLVNRKGKPVKILAR